MNPRFVVRSLTIEDGEHSTTYPFTTGVNVLIGATGTGKTSLLQTIKWALGGSAVRSAAVRDGVSSAAVRVDLNGHPFVFRRNRTDRLIEIIDGQTAALVARAATAGVTLREQASASDLLLERLGIPKIELPRARARSTRATTTISFWDVFDYMYVRQTEMDTSIVHHNDSVRNPKRRATFELLYGLIDEEVARLERQRGDLRSGIAEARHTTNAITAFLADSDEPPELALVLRAERLETDLRLAEERLESIRSGGRDGTPQADEQRAQLRDREQALADARAAQSANVAEIAKFDSVLSQLEVELDRLERSGVAVNLLSPFEFRDCPRCLQSIIDREVADGSCALCGQIEPTRDNRELIAAEHSRLEAQLAETVALRESAEQSLAAADDVVLELERTVSSLHDRLDAETAGFVSRSFSDIEEATRAVAELTAQREWIRRSLRLHARLREQAATSTRLSAELRECETSLGRARAALEEARARVQELSRLFDDLLRQFNYPWYDATTGAWIDPETYLPVTGSETFDEASSGMKTLLNVAYHVAGLRYGLQQEDSLLPLMLILDSPRKNLGLLEDREIGERVYRRLRALHEASGAAFQMIVAENDPPPLVDAFTTTRFTYDSPFVPWVRHPGPDEVQPIE